MGDASVAPLKRPRDAAATAAEGGDAKAGKRQREGVEAKEPDEPTSAETAGAAAGKTAAVKDGQAANTAAPSPEASAEGDEDEEDVPAEDAAAAAADEEEEEEEEEEDEEEEELEEAG